MEATRDKHTDSADSCGVLSIAFFFDLTKEAGVPHKWFCFSVD